MKFTGRQANTFFGQVLSWILPIVIMVAIWNFTMRRMNIGGAGILNVGQSKAKLVADKGAANITFADVAGIDEAKEELIEVVDFLKNPHKFEDLGGRIPRGVLLVGAPGTGKTLLAKAVAGEAGVPFFSISGSEFVEMFVGVGAARVRDLFNTAMGKAPCIIFIDELDALGKARGFNPIGGHDEREQTLNQLLVEMDGFDTRKGVIIMAATNRPEILDPALLRPGRFDRQVVVDRPDLIGREAILKIHSKGVKLDPDVDLKIIASRTPGMVGADLANICNESALLAVRRGKKTVTMSEFEEAIDRVIAGLEKKKRLISPKEKKIVAYHEAGHAVVAETLPNTDVVHKISIVPRGIAALGYTIQLPDRGPLPDDPEGAGGPPGRAAGREGDRGDGVRRRVHRRPERPEPGHGHRPGHGQGVRDERPHGPHRLRAPAQPLPAGRAVDAHREGVLREDRRGDRRRGPAHPGRNPHQDAPDHRGKTRHHRPAWPRCSSKRKSWTARSSRSPIHQPA